jgi:hypothetical protein
MKAGLGWATAVLRHAGWWLEWQTRRRAGDGCRALSLSQEPVTPRERAA